MRISGERKISNLSASGNFFEVIMETSKLVFAEMKSGTKILKLSCAIALSNAKNSKKHSIYVYLFKHPAAIKAINLISSTTYIDGENRCDLEAY